MLFLGKVTALSKNSITLSAQGHTVTAELTGSTRITGRLKLGDAVSAQITTVAGGKYAAPAIQDLPSLP
jgi:ABC-type molybdate transport system ATPase subunit